MVETLRNEFEKIVVGWNEKARELDSNYYVPEQETWKEKAALLLYPENRVGPHGQTERAWKALKKFEAATSELVAALMKAREERPQGAELYNMMLRDVEQFSEKLVSAYKGEVERIAKERGQ